MATLNEISNADQYGGNVVLGGAATPALNIDVKPLDPLSVYTQFYNKTLYDNQLKDRDAKIDQISKLSQIDLNNLRPNDRDQITKQLDDIKNYAVEYAKNPNRSVTEELAWQTKLGDLTNKYNSGKTRAVNYFAQANDIASKYTDASERDVAMKELNDSYDKTDISTQVPSQSFYKPVTVDVPAPVTIGTSIQLAGGNFTEASDATFFNPSANAPLAQQMSLGLHNLFPKKGTPEYDNLSSAEKFQANLQATKTSDSQAQVLSGGTTVVNQAIQSKSSDGTLKYFSKDASGNDVFDWDKFKTDYASNTVILKPVESVMNLTRYSTLKKQQAINHEFDDKGLKYTLPSNITPDMFNAGIVNISPDGLKPEQLIQGGMFAKYGGDTVTKKVTPTDNAIQEFNAETARKNVLLDYDAALKGQKNTLAIANLPFDKAKIGTTDKNGKPVAVVEEAKNFAVDLLNRIKNATKPDGTVDMAAAQLSPQDYQTMGLGTIDPKTGKFVYDPNSAIKEGTQLKFDSKTNKIIVPTSVIKKGWFTDDVHKPARYIDYAQIALNRYHFSAALTDSKEAQELNSISSGYGNGAGQTQQPPQVQVIAPSKKEIKEKDIPLKAANRGLTEQEYRDLLTTQGITIVK